MAELMALSDLQKRVLRVLAANRSDESYMAGGAVLNRDRPRLSDDFDVFHDTDEDIAPASERDIAALREQGFRVQIDILIYGIVEATVYDDGDSTVLQWMSETRWRFFPLVRDSEWGVRLHDADLAVNKMLAASTRSKARDFVDLFSIVETYCPLLTLVLAAAGKPPNFAPSRTIEEARRRLNGLPSEAFAEVRGLPADWTVERMRNRVRTALDEAETDLVHMPDTTVGCLVVDGNGHPAIARTMADLSRLQLRRPTADRQPLPIFKDVRPSFG
jgi:hypothetical protein